MKDNKNLDDYVTRLRINGREISDLVRIDNNTAVDHSLLHLSPSTRTHLYSGRIDGKKVVVVKPYESISEKIVTRAIQDSPFSLVLDYGQKYFVEEVPPVDSADLACSKGQLSAKELGEAVGTFLGNLHKIGINYNNTLEGHLFVYDNSIKVTDFGSSSFDRFGGGFVDDIVIGLEYLRDSLKSKGLAEIEKAIEAFKISYSKIANEEDFLKGIKRHLKFADKNDLVRNLLS